MNEIKDGVAARTRRDDWSIPTVERRTNAAGTTVLFGLEPRGLGTPNVEALSSYTLRLAAAHVKRHTTFIEQLITKPHARAYPNSVGFEVLPNINQSVNGSTYLGALLVGYLEAFTGVPTIRRTALFGRMSAVRLRSVFREYRAWCPYCLAGDGHTPYDRLLWSFRAYTVCVVHERALVDACGSCRARRRTFRADVRLARCAQCRKQLASAAKGRRRRVDAETQIVYDLLARIESGRGVTRQEIRNGASHAIAAYGTYDAASALGLPGTLHRMAVGSVRVDLASFIQVVARSGDSLDEFLARSAQPLRRKAWAPRKRRPAKRVKRQLALIAELRALEERSGATNFNALCRKHGVGPDWIKRAEPALVASLVARGRAQRHTGIAVRIARDVAQIQADVVRAHAAHPEATRGTLQKFLPNAGRFRNPTLKEAAFEQLNQLQQGGAP